MPNKSETTMPQRIQRKRSKGWRMPKGAVYVGRPSVWGNPIEVDERGADYAVDQFRRYVARSAEITPTHPANIRKALRGKHLVCWCRLDRPCHADVLLECANAD